MTQRRARSAPALLLGLCCLALLVTACGSAEVQIPHGSPLSSAPADVTIAPGVAVPAEALALPPYSESASRPPPTGVDQRLLVKDFIEDNLIENAALERGDAHLLQYADANGMLSVNSTAIADDLSQSTRMISVSDSFQSVTVGTKPDPNNSGIQLALLVTGTEWTVVRHGSGPTVRKSDPFRALVWMIWSGQMRRYLRCDLAVL